MAKKAVEGKKLKLVCKCGDCKDWEIIVKLSPDGSYQNSQELLCASCGETIPCDFRVPPHEGLHYEKV